jgi:hypothetical protein
MHLIRITRFYDPLVRYFNVNGIDPITPTRWLAYSLIRAQAISSTYCSCYEQMEILSEEESLFLVSMHEIMGL